MASNFKQCFTGSHEIRTLQFRSRGILRNSIEYPLLAIWRTQKSDVIDLQASTSARRRAPSGINSLVVVSCRMGILGGLSGGGGGRPCSLYLKRALLLFHLGLGHWLNPLGLKPDPEG